MDSWSEIQIKKMDAGGNERLNNFLAQYGISKETDIISKYNSNAASVYRDRIQALAEGRQWRDPPIVKESVGGGLMNKKPPLSQGGGRDSGNGGWDNWDNDDSFRSTDMRRNQSAGDFRSSGGRGAPAKSKSSEDIYSRSQLEASAANKESFFAKRMAENESKPEGLPPSQGGKYVGFGSSPGPAPRSNQQSGGGDVFSVMSEGFGRLSLVAASAANVVQTGTMEFTSKVKEGGLDQTVSETVNVVASKTTEIGQRTWGIMKGVMAIASQKVEEFTKEEASTWNQQNKTEGNGYYQNSGIGNKTANSSFGGSQSSSSGHNNSYRNSNSWDDWGEENNSKKEAAPKVSTSNDDDDGGWAGWDDNDAKDDDFYYQPASDKKSVGHNGKSDTAWTGGGFL